MSNIWHARFSHTSILSYIINHIFQTKWCPLKSAFAFIGVSEVIYYFLILEIDKRRPQLIERRFVNTCRHIGSRLQDQNINLRLENVTLDVDVDLRITMLHVDLDVDLMIGRR